MKNKLKDGIHKLLLQIPDTSQKRGHVTLLESYNTAWLFGLNGSQLAKM